EVDDISSTPLAAALGSRASLLLLRRRKDLADASAPRPITVTRRLTGIVCDLLIWGLSGWTVYIVFMAFAALLGDGTITEPDPIVVFIGFAPPFVAQLYSVLSRGDPRRTARPHRRRSGAQAGAARPESALPLRHRRVHAAVPVDVPAVRA